MKVLNLDCVNVLTVKLRLDRKVRVSFCFCVWHMKKGMFLLLLLLLMKVRLILYSVLHNQVNIPKASNICVGFDDFSGWTFFDLNTIHDEHKAEPVTVVEADFVSLYQFFCQLKLKS